MHDEKELKWFDRMGKNRPTHEEHGVVDTWENPLSEQLPRLKTRNWRLEGNTLIADTDQGPLVQTIPTNYICKGTDDKGMPILVKIG